MNAQLKKILLVAGLVVLAAFIVINLIIMRYDREVAVPVVVQAPLAAPAPDTDTVEGSPAVEEPGLIPNDESLQ